MFKMFSPLEQFEVAPLLYLFRAFELFGLTVTNFTFFAVVSFLLFIIFLTIALFGLRLVPTFRQYLLEYLYDFVWAMIATNIGLKGGRYFPFIFTLFSFILIFN